MDIHVLHSDPPLHLHQPLCFAFSYKKCCLILLLVFGLIVLASGAFVLIVVFILKPRKPSFSVQNTNIASYKLDVVSDTTLLVSLVASIILSAQNPNKVGIKYSHSRLHILNDGYIVGMIRIPEFYQPAQSLNVSVQTDILFQSLNVSTIMSGANASNFSVRVLGDIVVRLQLLGINWPKMKVALDCYVGVDSRYLASSNEDSILKTSNDLLAHFAANSQAFSKKCSISFYL